MNSKYLLVLVALLACFAGFALSASIDSSSQDVWRQLLGNPKICHICQTLVDKVKQSGQLDQIKQQVEGLCLLLNDPEKTNACMKQVDQYISDIEKKSALEVCTEFKLCP